MSRQEKSITERHSKILRELVKKPENKVCADCKRNDPRWASWNIGVFLCIRCSGIHRSMGTHISKVKSVDLDIWTPEQMESIQKWGNARANLYWEAHLKAGHVPPDHKMDSFIRSKYESRRWALEGPPPKDPSILDNDSVRQDASSPPLPPPPSESQKLPPSFPAPPVTSNQTAQRKVARPLLSSQTRSLPAAPQTPATQQVQRQQQQQQQPPAAAPKSTQEDLFSLDFHNPTPNAQTSQPNEPQRNVKADILSLYSTATPTGAGMFGGGFAAVPQAQHSAPAVTSMVGGAGTGMWGVQSGWNGSTQQASPTTTNGWNQPQVNNAWGQPVVQQPVQQSFGAFGNFTSASNSAFGTQDIWGNLTSSPATSGGGIPSNDLFGSSFSTAATTAAAQPKKDDAFGDIWGGFK
ncbi:hypothetical protein Clacol_008099 [Clathrus columnatus]|uniref:Arf-GAP domain-containing protein n=1 Tax=Clathrus columnatus TaxID=1419009 RepID=A0AAV5AJH2_9AGAM|nr:hypothetical protein Clacol_008099 [Clathrus columnatus]